MKYSRTSESTLTIKSWAEEDRPREKLLLKGAKALSDAELLAILIGSGTVSLSAVELGRQILQSSHNNLHKLAKLSIEDLKKFKGIGEAKAISIVSALELGRRRKDVEPLHQPKITCSQDVYELMKAYLLDLAHEEFWVIFLSRYHKVTKIDMISKGGIAGTVVDPRLVFKRALAESSSGIILIHNHPSGNTSPSEADINLTQKLKRGGLLLDIPVVDHIIFTDIGYFSFADEHIL